MRTTKFTSLFGTFKNVKTDTALNIAVRRLSVAPNRASTPFDVVVNLITHQAISELFAASVRLSKSNL